MAFVCYFLTDCYITRLPRSSFYGGGGGLAYTNKPYKPDVDAVIRVLEAVGGPSSVNLILNGHSHFDHSFDFRNANFVLVNEYYDGTSDSMNDGDITEPIYNWLKNDLEANSKPFVFVFGHEPIVSIPDYHNGRRRHKGDILDAHPENSHRFQQLLRKHKAVAYICGHTHGFSYSKINGLWQLDAGHCRGIGDKGAQSTFLKILVGKRTCRAEVYRDNSNGWPYILTQTIVLD